jgi:DNA transformation protein and related proteins
MATTKGSNEFADYCVELLGVLGAARSRRMFGGHGLYVDDLFVAIVDDDELYLKVDAQTRPQFEAAGCKPFVYDKTGQAVAMGYWSAPGEATESPTQMLPWARLALGAALRARAAKAPRQRAGVSGSSAPTRPRRAARE